MFRILMSLLILQSCMPGEYDDMEKTDVFIEENESYNSFDRSRNPSGELDESSVQISPQMADRFYISNVLIDIFGEQVDQLCPVFDSDWRVNHGYYIDPVEAVVKSGSTS